MRFIGNKENILPKIDEILKSRQIIGESFFDLFSGTTNVARFYKKQDCRVISSDFLYFSYCLQNAYIKNNTEPDFERLLPEIQFESTALLSTPLELVVDYLNQLPGTEGFIYRNYTPGGTADLSRPRMYFTDDNGKRIDTIRKTIEDWNQKKLVSESEYYILLSCLIESVPFYANISGVYAAFQKKWDPRAVKPFYLRSIEIIKNKHQNKTYNQDSVSLCSQISTDVLYLDPPYNERQYAPNYHVLETIAKYDSPEIRGITGMRNYDHQKSTFCNATSALSSLDNIARTGKYRFLVMSYNSEGIMPHEDIIHTLTD